MKVLLLTVAGMSGRFSESLGKDSLKCIYYEDNVKESLLYNMFCQDVKFDKFVVVGGFMFEKLKEFIDEYLAEFKSKIILVNNQKYKSYGSGYSLYLGLREVMAIGFNEVVFAEGDLYVDSRSFRQIYCQPGDVVTYNSENILAEKAVAFYYDMQHRIHYIYDTSHNALEIREPFTGIFNSGQIWKFARPERLRNIFGSTSLPEWKGTNLLFIQKYFGGLTKTDYHMSGFRTWINCNTIFDFKKIKEEMQNKPDMEV